MGKCVNVDELKEWVDNWVNVYKYYHPYAKNFDIPIDELNDILERIPPVSVECVSLAESGVCKCFHEVTTKRALSDFQKCMMYALTGKQIDSIKVVEGKCWGTKECEMCKCGGDRSKCDFYPTKRKEK